MIHTVFPVDGVLNAVVRGIPGFRLEDAPAMPAGPGDYAEYGLRCTRNEMIDDFTVKVEMSSADEASVTVTGTDGRSASGRILMSTEGLAGNLPSSGVVMAVELLPTAFGDRSCEVRIVSGKWVGIMWVCDGIAYRTIHDAGGYRLSLDIRSSSLL